MVQLAAWTMTDLSLAASAVHADVVATDLKSNGTAGKVVAATSGSYASNPVLTALPSGGSGVGHRNLTDSFEVTITPDAGITLGLTTFTFKAARGGSSTNRGFHLTSSVDGHTAALLAVPSIATSRSTWSSYDVDLSGLGPITSSLTLRFYFFTGGSSLSIDFDDLVLNGTVSAPPPPPPPDPLGELLHAHHFGGTVGQPFAGDAVYTNLAGTVPTVVDAGGGELGLRFAAAAQGLVVAAIPSTTGRLVYDVIFTNAATSTGNVETVQFRGAAKVVSLNKTSTGKMSLQHGTATPITYTGDVPAPGTPFRVRVDVNNGTGNASATVYASKANDAAVLGSVVTAQATATAITSVRLGYSGTGGTGTLTAQAPQLATHPDSLPARVFGTQEPGPEPDPEPDFLLDHHFDGLNGTLFNGDAAFKMVVPTAPPTYVRNAFGRGLRFNGGQQGIVEHVFDPAPGDGVLNFDVPLRLSAHVKALSGVLQTRAGAARGPEVSLVAVNGVTQVRLLRLSGADGVSVDTSEMVAGVKVGGTTEATVPRLAFSVDGPTLRVRLYQDQTTTAPAELKPGVTEFVSTVSDDVDITAFRLGVISALGLGEGVTLDVFNPRVSRSQVPGPPDYPTLTQEPPRALAALVQPAEPWSVAQLSGSAVAGSASVVSLEWSADAGSPTLSPGAGASRTVAVPAAMVTEVYSYTLTATAADGLVSTAKVLVEVRPASFGWWNPAHPDADEDGLVPMRVQLVDELAPPPLGQLVVSNFQASAPTTTGRVITFETNVGVPVTRIMEYRPASGGDWILHSIVTRERTHTAGFNGQTAGVGYKTRMTLDAEGFASKVMTSDEYPELDYTTASVIVNPPVNPPTGPGAKLTIRPPELVDPLTIEIPVQGQSYKGLAGRDVRWIMPSKPVTGTVSIYGGRNHVIIGGETLSDDGGMSFDLEEYEGTFYVQGLRVDPTGVGASTPYPADAPSIDRPDPPFYSDGFRANSRQPNSHFIMQDVWGRVDGFAKYADGSNGPHGDFVQLYRGPSRFTAKKVTCETYYQGFFLLAAQYSGAPAFGPYTFEDINVWRHTSGGGAGAWTLSGPAASLVSVKNCHARRDPGSNTNLASGPGTTENGWTVSTEAPPGGDFTPRSTVGVGYSNPGYV